MECNYNIHLNILESIFKPFDLIAIDMLNSCMHLFTKKIYKWHLVNYFQFNSTIFTKNQENNIKFKRKYVGQVSQTAFPSIIKSCMRKPSLKPVTFIKQKSKQSSGSKENLNKPEQTIAHSFLQQRHPFLQGPSLRMTQQAAPIQPEGSPQARRATGWLFVTKCSRLNADITVISSPTKPEAKNRGKS